MNTEIKSNDKQSSTMNYLSKKAGELYGKVIKFEDKLFAGETEGITLKAVGCLARGIGLVSATTVKYVKAPFGKKKEIEEILGTEEPEKAAPAAEADAPEEAHVEEAAAPEEEAAAPEEEAVAPKEEVVAPKEEVEEEEEAEEEAPAEYTLEELQEKTKAQLLEIVEELGVPDVAAWRPKNEIIDQIIEFQEEEE